MTIMKKYYLLATALAAIVSCTSDDFIGENGADQAQSGNGAILFGFDLQNATRADKVGSAAATALQSQFIVYGTKHTSAEAVDASNDAVVFQNYVVEYAANSAGHTTSNTHNWEYVAKTPYAESIVSPAITGSQAIKYWDYSAAQGYTFYGIASKEDLSKKDGGQNPDPLVTITKTTTGSTIYDKGYSVVIKNGAHLDQLYVSDRLPVAKTDYNKPVTLKFRNFGSRVRVGFYETIPGYTVTINKFYYDDNAEAVVTTFGAMDAGNTTSFAASLQNINRSANNTATVSYCNGTDGPLNQAKVTVPTANYSYTLTLGSGVINTVLATSASTPTWDQTAGAYTTVYPNEANSNPMLLKVDYTLTPEDGSNGVIKVQGANVVVPTQYVQWKSNFAYTYLFKISDNTNGSTDGTTAGLYPITFDAITVAVEDNKTQETITNFEDYAITTYANGSNVTTNNEYKSGETIYVVLTDNSTGAVVVPSAIGTAQGNAQVYVATTDGDAISEATIKANLNGSPNGITLTPTADTQVATRVANGQVPAADGSSYNFTANGVVQFTPSTESAKTYVYVYARTPYEAPTYTAVDANDNYTATTYYFKTEAPDNVYYPAASINADNFAANKANLFTKTANGTPGVYDVKVIRVVP